MSGLPSTFKGIRELFYETRVLRGRDWTIRRFAAELGVDPVLLGYIEKGERFPNEELVRKLAKLRGEDSRELLAVLYRDRMVRALAREIRRAMAGAAVDDGGEGDEPTPGVSFSMALSQAFAALPDDGSPVPLATFRKAVNGALEDAFGKASRADAKRIETVLAEKGLIEVGAREVRKMGHHIHAQASDERLDLALEFAAIFAKSLTDKLVRDRRGTYLKNHFLLISPERVDAFRNKLDGAIQEVVKEFAASGDGAGDGRGPGASRVAVPADFVRILVAGTQKE
ncbi:MAG: helix-turn-helix transcriptional regulator [Deltaproteobacteria bacterium]|nr:helix-turn-helix transcriptional regulator [Deltaproteobacteria bacterium]